MASWPATLPNPLIAGHAVSMVDPVIRTEMESGASRKRRRTFARNDHLTLSWVMSGAQVAIFRAWFDSNTGASGGAAWFTVDLAIATGGSVTVDASFLKAPQITRIGQESWSVSGELEVR